MLKKIALVVLAALALALALGVGFIAAKHRATKYCLLISG